MYQTFPLLLVQQTPVAGVVVGTTIGLAARAL
jgi:hypothetical protein